MKAYEVLRKSVIGLIIRGSMIGSGLVAVASAFSPATVMAESQEDFDITNNTGTTITGVYVAAHGTTESWGENCLSSPLRPGQTRHISWPQESGIPNWDIRITYSTGVEVRFNGGVDLSQYSRLAVSLRDGGTVTHLDAFQA
ncbi:MAG TPA: hypothetical protein VGH07_09405 [Chthoniobacterales bacterium]|jgi:hypothetical protein